VAIQKIDQHSIYWESAACRGKDQDLFFPKDVSNEMAYDAGKTICSNCSMREDCLAYGLREEMGLWGGMTPNERRRYKRHYYLRTAPESERSVKVRKALDLYNKGLTTRQIGVHLSVTIDTARRLLRDGQRLSKEESVKS
jgi:hypothetical protein